jgi:hypothetical protein
MRTALFSFLIALQPILLSACTSPVPPTVSFGPAGAISGEPEVVLVAVRQVARIDQSLRGAGITPASGSSGAEYALQVNVGSGRGSGSCGLTRNVTYVLRANGERVLVIEGRGRTGSCVPNIFDDMSRRLASFFR